MLDSYRDLIDGLTATPSALRDLLGRSGWYPIPADVPAEVASLLAELCSREAVEVRRVQAIMRNRTARLRAIEYEPEVANPTVDDPAAMLARFNDERSELISLLVNLTLKDWDRALDHESRGEITLADEIDDHLTWDEDMLATFEALT